MFFLFIITMTFIIIINLWIFFWLIIISIIILSFQKAFFTAFVFNSILIDVKVLSLIIIRFFLWFIFFVLNYHLFFPLARWVFSFFLLFIRTVGCSSNRSRNHSLIIRFACFFLLLFIEWRRFNWSSMFYIRLKTFRHSWFLVIIASIPNPICTKTCLFEGCRNKLWFAFVFNTLKSFRVLNFIILIIFFLIYVKTKLFCLLKIPLFFWMRIKTLNFNFLLTLLLLKIILKVIIITSVSLNQILIILYSMFLLQIFCCFLFIRGITWIFFIIYILGHFIIFLSVLQCLIWYSWTLIHLIFKSLVFIHLHI